MKYALVVFLMERPRSLLRMAANTPWSMDRWNLAITSTGLKMHVTLTVISRLTGDIVTSDEVSRKENALKVLLSVSVRVFSDSLLMRVTIRTVEVAFMSRTADTV